MKGSVVWKNDLEWGDLAHMEEKRREEKHSLKCRSNGSCDTSAALFQKYTFRGR